MTEPVEIKIARVEERQEALSKVVYEIKDNHLAHLAVAVDDIKKSQDKVNITIAKWTGGMAVVIVIAEWLLRKIQ